MMASLVFKALGDETRLKIVQLLSSKELCACRILERLEITQPTLSHHMKILSECEIVNARKQGKWTYYSVNSQTIKALKDFVNNLD